MELPLRRKILLGQRLVTVCFVCAKLLLKVIPVKICYTDFVA